MAKRYMLYVWSDIVMARNRSVRYPSSVAPTGFLVAPCPSRSSMRSHPLPSRGGVRGGVCNVCNILSAKKRQRRRGSEEEAAKKRQRRRSSEEEAAKKKQRRRSSEEEAAKKKQRRRSSEEGTAKKGQRRRDSEEGTAKKKQRRRDSEEGTAKKRQLISYRPHPCPSP